MGWLGVQQEVFNELLVGVRKSKKLLKFIDGPPFLPFCNYFRLGWLHLYPVVRDDRTHWFDFGPWELWFLRIQHRVMLSPYFDCLRYYLLVVNLFICIGHGVIQECRGVFPIPPSRKSRTKYWKYLWAPVSPKDIGNKAHYPAQKRNSIFSFSRLTTLKCLHALQMTSLVKLMASRRKSTGQIFSDSGHLFLTVGCSSIGNWEWLEATMLLVCEKNRGSLGYQSLNSLIQKKRCILEILVYEDIGIWIIAIPRQLFQNLILLVFGWNTNTPDLA